MTMWLNPGGTKFKSPYDEKIKQAKENLKVEFNPTPEYVASQENPVNSPAHSSFLPKKNFLSSLEQSPTWQKIKVGDIKGLANELGLGLAHGLANTGTARNNALFDQMLAQSKEPGTATYGQQQVANRQTQQNFLNANPVNSLPAMLGEQIPQIPLWMSGELGLKAVGKGIGKLAPSLTTKAETVGAKLPSFVKGGLLDAATYGSVVSPVESIRNGDNFNQFLDREKELPTVLAGGILGRGAFDGLKLGKDVVGEGGSLKQALALRKLNLPPETTVNPLTDIQNAYRNPALNAELKVTPRTLSRSEIAPIDSSLSSKYGDVSKWDDDTFNSTINALKAENEDKLNVLVDTYSKYKPQGVENGGVGFNTEGDAINRWGRISNNSPWYQAAFEEFGHQPTKEELRQFAIDELRNGRSNSLEGNIPSNPAFVQNEKDIANLERLRNPQNYKQVTSATLPQREITFTEPKLKSGEPLNTRETELTPTNVLSSRSNNGLGVEVIEPRLQMNIQRFNNPVNELPNTMEHLVSKTDRQRPELDTLKTSAYIKTTDNLHRLNQLDQYVEGITGQKLSPEDKSYMLALNSRGAGSTSSSILEDNLVNPKGEKIGDSLKNITKQLKNKQTMKEFDDYLVNKHAITRMKLGEKVFPDEMEMTPNKAEAKEKQYEAIHPEFKELSDKLYEFQNKLAKAWLVDTGIVPPEAYVKWISDNPHYVPNNRLFSEMEQTSFNRAKRGFANQSNPVKARTGSQRKIISPLESIMEHVDQYVKVARRNEVMQTLIRNIKKNPEEFKDWAEILPDDKQLKQGLMDDINKTLETEGLDGVVEQFNKQFDDIFNAKKQRLDLGNVVTGLVNGERVHVKINDPLLLDALTNLKPQAQQIVVAALGQVTRVMKNLTTGINPVFGLARNIWRDIPTAFINSKSTNNPLVYGKDLLGAVVDVMGNKEAYKSYKAMGGGHASSSVSTGRNALAESKARLLPGYALKHPFKTALGGLEQLNNAVESAPRLAEFKRISKPGDYGSKVKGIYESNDVTTNFNKFGNYVKEVDSIIPYLNAAWQGLDKLARTFRNNPVQAGSKALVSVTFPTILLYQLNHSNPAYQQLSDYIKDNNFLIPKADGTFIKVPKPREIGTIFGSSVERIMRQWEDQDPDGFNRFGETIKTNFLPPGRTILAPLNDIRSNKDFMDRPIVSGTVSKLSPYLQFDEKTSEPAKSIGKALNISPQQLDYLARSYLGGVAQLGLPATTKNASVSDTLKRQVTADPVFSNDIIGDFYNTKTKMETSASDAKATGNNSLEQGKNYKTQFNKAADQLSDIRKQIDKVQAGTLPKEEKELRIKALQLQMLNIAKKSNNAFKLK